MRPLLCTFVVLVRIVAATLLFVVLAIATSNAAVADSNSGPSPIEQMLQAVNSGNQKAIMMLMQSGMVADPMLIHMCAQKGFDTAALLLLEHGAKAGQQFEQYGTPLHTAANSGQLRMTQLLVKHGSPVNEVGRDGFQPLHLASQNGRASVVRFLIKKGANVNGSESTRPSPLAMAARHNHAEAVRVLLKGGAALDATALHVAVEHGHEEVVRVLLKAGAALLQDGRGFNALHIAAVGSPQASERASERVSGIALRGGANTTSVSMVQLVLAHGVDVGALTPDASTALHIAAEAGNVQGIAELIAAGGAVEARNGKGLTPLHSAIWFGKREAARELLEVGKADPNTRSLKQLAPLHEAANEGMLEEVELLLSRGAATEVEDATGATPLLLAAREGWKEVVETLLRGGAACLGRDERGVRAVHMAAHEGHVRVLRVLLAACGGRGPGGVDVSTDAGHTALHAAAFDGQAEAVKELIAHGADTAARTKGGLTALEIAQQQAQTRAAEDGGRLEPEDSVVELLLQHTQRAREQTPSGMHEGACASERRREELAAIAGEHEGVWPWQAARGEAAVGHVNVSVRIAQAASGSMAVETFQLPLYPLPVLRVHPPPPPAHADAGSPPSSSSSSAAAASSSSSSSSTSTSYSPSLSTPSLLLTAPHVHAAALHTGPLLGEGARRTLRKVKRLRRALSWQQGESTRRFCSKHWPMTTLIQVVQQQQAAPVLSAHNRTPAAAPLILAGRADGEQGGVTHSRPELLRALLSTFEGYVEEVRRTAAPLLGCAPAALRCPDFGVVYRIDPDLYLSYVHTDFPSDAEASFNRQHGLTRDDWWNVWVLLSEKPFGRPLALLDPDQVGATRPGYQEPPKEMREGKGGWDAFTYVGMRQGDAIAWRTTKVPHAGSTLVREVREGSPQWEDSGAAVQQRESLDVRCVCLKT